MNTHYEGKKKILYTIEIENTNGKNTQIKFFNSKKANEFHNKVKFSPTCKNIQKNKTYLSAREFRKELQKMRQRRKQKCQEQDYSK